MVLPPYISMDNSCSDILQIYYIVECYVYVDLITITVKGGGVNINKRKKENKTDGIF